MGFQNEALRVAVCTTLDLPPARVESAGMMIAADGVSATIRWHGDLNGEAEVAGDPLDTILAAIHLDIPH